MNAFEQKKAAAVERADMAVQAAWTRLQDALAGYEQEVRNHEARGDGFFSREYRLARSEAVRARKHYDLKCSQLNTARAESAAPTLLAEWDDA